MAVEMLKCGRRKKHMRDGERQRMLDKEKIGWDRWLTHNWQEWKQGLGLVAGSCWVTGENSVLPHNLGNYTL